MLVGTHNHLIEVRFNRGIHLPDLDLWLDPWDAKPRAFVSHAHADHFDLPSVNLLPRRVPVLLPDDGEMIACVRGLGFTQVAILRDFEAIELGELTIVPTPAAPGAIEHGFILVHDGVTAWNMIDTFPSEAAIDMVLDQYGPIDLLISP